MDSTRACAANAIQAHGPEPRLQLLVTDISEVRVQVSELAIAPLINP